MENRLISKLINECECGGEIILLREKGIATERNVCEKCFKLYAVFLGEKSDLIGRWLLKRELKKQRKKYEQQI